jgi:WD40 repeat protein
VNEAAQGRAWRAGEVIDGRYEVIRLAGKGGMGRVYQVRHLQWGIDLAAKQPRPDALDSPGARGQFAEEAEAWVSLGLHPNICCCYYVRQFDGLPMVFAEYVPGGSLHDWIADRRLYEGPDADVLRRVLDVAVQFAWGLEHAHRRGIVHQDVKPRNVLLDASDGDISVKVTDFGLARAGAGTGLASLDLDGDAGGGASVLVSRAGLTPEYASPEQMRRVVLSQRTDVYSYAVSVLEMFTGKRLWRRGDKAGQALSAYLAKGAAEPGMPPMPPALGALLQRCLLEEPEDPRPEDPRRPKSMAGVAAEISGIYQSAVRSAYPRTMPRAADFLADGLNNRALSLLDLGREDEAEQAFTRALSTDARHLLATYNYGLLGWRRGEFTDEDLVAAVTAVNTDPDHARLGAQLLAQIDLERGELDSARNLGGGPQESREDRATSDELALREALHSGRMADACCVTELSLDWPPEPPTELSWAPGPVPTRILRDGRAALTAHWDGTLRLWDLSSGRRAAMLEGHTGRVDKLDVSADNQSALSYSRYDNTVRVWSLASRRCRHVLTASAARAEPDGAPPLGQTTPDPVLKTEMDRIFDSAKRAMTLGQHFQELASLRTIQADRKLAVQAQQRPRARYPIGMWLGRSLALYSDFDEDVSRTWRSGEQRVRIWRLDTGELVEDLRERAAGSTLGQISFTASGRFAVTIDHGSGVEVWNVHTGQLVRTLTGRKARVSAVSMTSNGAFLLAGRDDGAMEFWCVPLARCVRTFQAHQGEVADLLLAEDAMTAISIGHDGTVRRWRLPHGDYTAPAQLSRPRSPKELDELGKRVDDLLIRADRAAAGSDDTAAHALLIQARATSGYERAPRVLDAWRALGNRAGHSGLRGWWRSKSLATTGTAVSDLSADGRIAVTGGSNGLIQVWDTDTGTLVNTITSEVRHPKSGCLSRDGNLLLCVATKRAQVLRVQTGEAVCTLPGEDNSTGRFDHLGSQVMLGGWYGLKRWDLHTGRWLPGLHYGWSPAEVIARQGKGVPASGVGQMESVWPGADGRHLVSASMYAVQYWDLDAGRCVHELTGHAHEVHTASLSTDGRVAVGTSRHGTPSIRLWDTTTGRELYHADDAGGPAYVARLTADSRFLFSGAAGGTTVREVADGRVLGVIESRTFVLDLALSDDARLLLTREGDGVHLWELDWDPAGGRLADVEQ